MKTVLGLGLALVLLVWLLPARRAGREAEPRSLARMPHLLSTGFPLELENDGVRLELAVPPRRILPTNAAWVDFVSLLIAPERVVALPTDALGYSRLAREPGPWAGLAPFTGFEGERILALEPDLVLAHAWQNAQTVAGLRRAGCPVLVLPVPESWEEIRSTVELLGAVLDVQDRACILVEELDQRCSALARRARPHAGLRALCYTNLGAGGWTCGTRTTGDVLLRLAGLRNAAADAGLAGDVPADRERLIALAPDLIVVGRPDRTESSAPSADYLRSEPALGALAAVREDRIVTLAPALFTTASPELLRGAEMLVDELERRADR